MKAAVLYKPNMGLEVVDVEQQGPQAGEARVKVKAAGVCHSDWHIMNGDWPLPLPMASSRAVAPAGTAGGQAPRHRVSSHLVAHDEVGEQPRHR